MKGYKATYNMKCLDLTYEVDKTYNISNINICNHGLHYCKEMKDVLEYYDYNNTFILLEIEDLGSCVTWPRVNSRIGMGRRTTTD